ncbi:hypothetical protein V2J67_22930 [Pseudomonas alliivorans]|nr:hypothetical protein [Pseudomonas alliivorans]
MEMRTALLAGVLATILAAPVLADQALRGVIQGSGGNMVIAVDLTLDNPEPTYGRMKFSPPASCYALIKLESQEGTKRSYTFVNNARGPFCEALVGGKMFLNASDGKTYIRIKSGQSDREWGGSLHPAQ